jgi:ketosteroid isomerase-like protein
MIVKLCGIRREEDALRAAGNQIEGKQGGRMNILKSIILSLIISVQVAAAQDNITDARLRDAETVKQIKQLEEARNLAILKGDAATIERMTADDYTFITLKGELRTKADIVKGFASGAFKYQARTISDLNIRLYGDTAVVTGRSSQKGLENGKDYSGDYWFTRVYVKQNGAWMTVALQTTMIQK